MDAPMAQRNYKKGKNQSKISVSEKIKIIMECISVHGNLIIINISK